MPSTVFLCTGCVLGPTREHHMTTESGPLVWHSSTQGERSCPPHPARQQHRPAPDPVTPNRDYASGGMSVSVSKFGFSWTNLRKDPVDDRSVTEIVLGPLARRLGDPRAVYPHPAQAVVLLHRRYSHPRSEAPQSSSKSCWTRNSERSASRDVCGRAVS